MVDPGSIKLTRDDNWEGSDKGRHHYIPQGLIADIESDDTVRPSANAAVALRFEE